MCVKVCIMDERPSPPPEGDLIAAALERTGLSIRKASRRAHISYGRWRQITSGYQNISPGVYAPVHAPPKTLARMAWVVGLTPEALVSAGREDAARELKELSLAAQPLPEGERPRYSDPEIDRLAADIWKLDADEELRRGMIAFAVSLRMQAEQRREAG